MDHFQWSFYFRLFLLLFLSASFSLQTGSHGHFQWAPNPQLRIRCPVMWLYLSQGEVGLLRTESLSQQPPYLGSYDCLLTSLASVFSFQSWTASPQQMTHLVLSTFSLELITAQQALGACPLGLHLSALFLVHSCGYLFYSLVMLFWILSFIFCAVRFLGESLSRLCTALCLKDHWRRMPALGVGSASSSVQAEDSRKEYNNSFFTVMLDLPRIIPTVG